ncbi:MAG TPA: hypothetical protein VHG09_10045 [Longimicrobiales bacterium]|nr:hypothetical protein [Longimicrobiales bacterium]
MRDGFAVGRGLIQDRQQLAVQAPAIRFGSGAESFENGVGYAADGESAMGHDYNMTA